MFPPTGDKKSDKSSRRKQKDAAWWSKQKDKEKSKPVVVSEDTKKSLPCKYYLSGNCKNVRLSVMSCTCTVYVLLNIDLLPGTSFCLS